MPKTHPRPAKEFTVDSIAWIIQREQRFHSAGFPPVPCEVLLRRFWQLVCFLQQRGLTVRQIAGSIADISEESVLRNSDLTDEGFYFLQRFHGRWTNRASKDRGEQKEEAFLTKWYDQFLLQRPDA